MGKKKDVDKVRRGPRLEGKSLGPLQPHVNLESCCGRQAGSLDGLINSLTCRFRSRPSVIIAAQPGSRVGNHRI